MAHHVDPLARSHQRAQEWLAVIAEQVGTGDRRTAYRVTRAWLHLVRDRLTVDSAVHFAAQLPEFLRGVYFDGWTPSRVPVRYDAARFTELFADEANIDPADAPAIAGAVSAAFTVLCSPGQLNHIFALMPAGLRGELEGEAPAPAPRRTTENTRITELEGAVLALTQAVSALVRGLEELPTKEPAGDRAAKAAQEAHRILMAQEPAQT
jgi:uncharacterized protein (DUF2267 family)